MSLSFFHGMVGDGVVSMLHLNTNNSNSAALYFYLGFHDRFDVGCTFDFA